MVLMGTMPLKEEMALFYTIIVKLQNQLDWGYTSSQIQEKIGCCKDTIYKVLKANNIKIRKSNAKLIAQYDLAGNFIQVFFGSREAQEWLINNGITDNKSAQSHIIGCCKNKTKSQYGYIWKYLPEPI